MKNNELDTPLERPPTLQAALHEQAGHRFAEARDPHLSLKEEVSPAKALLGRMKDMSPEERAHAGAHVGAAIGAAGGGGDHGAVIGAAVGAYAGRGLGLVQSGAHQDGVRMDRIASTLMNMGIVNKNGAIKLKDGTELPMLHTPDTKLPNQNEILHGKDRPPHELDKSNPLTKRTMSVARPLARYLAGGLLKYNSDRNISDKRAVDRTTALLVNSLQWNAPNIDTVYNRAKEVMGKFDVTAKQLENYFATIKAQLSDKEAMDIKHGLSILGTK